MTVVQPATKYEPGALTKRGGMQWEERIPIYTSTNCLKFSTRTFYSADPPNGRLD